MALGPAAQGLTGSAMFVCFGSAELDNLDGLTLVPPLSLLPRKLAWFALAACCSGVCLASVAQISSHCLYVGVINFRITGFQQVSWLRPDLHTHTRIHIQNRIPWTGTEGCRHAGKRGPAFARMLLDAFCVMPVVLLFNKPRTFRDPSMWLSTVDVAHSAGKPHQSVQHVSLSGL